MNPRTSIKARILWFNIGLLLTALLVFLLIAGRQISASTLQDYEGNVLEQVQLLARSLKEPVEHLAEGEESIASMNGRLQEYSSQTGMDVNLFRADGHDLIAGTSSANALSTGPEITLAQEGEIGSNSRTDANGEPVLYAAAPIYEDGRLLGVVQIAAPLSGTQAVVMERWGKLAGGFLLLLILAAAASFGLARTLTKPVNTLRDSALQIAEGDFSQRIPEERRDELGQLASAFNHMTIQVEAMIEEQRAFASNASHELRTPLTAIRLRSEALRNGSLKEEQAQQYIAEIDSEAARMGNLVQDLILISRLESGRLEMGQAHIDIERLARSLLQENQRLLKQKQIEMVLEIAENLPNLVGSLTHLQVVFRNLLHNAIKYTPENGRITWQINADDHYLHSTITDNGQGIAPADQEHIFERFYRADKAHTREIPGTGLGLPLSKLIVELYGGQIKIHSPGMNQGTTAEVRWPFP